MTPMGIMDSLAMLAQQAPGQVIAQRTATLEGQNTGQGIARQLAEKAQMQQRQLAQDALEADYKRQQMEHLRAQTESLQHPNDPSWQVVEGEDGVYQVNPKSGETRPVMAPGGRQIVKPRRPMAAPSEPNWTTVQTDEGLMQVNPKTGETRQVTAGNGRQIRRQAPAQIAQAVSSNRKQLNVIDDAIRLLESHPNAVGLKYNVIPDALSQVLNPQGVETRAAVSDIGSLQIHDRTGAAMNAAESIRLKPFVPGPGDQPAAAITKLKRLKAALQDDTEFLSQHYGIGANDAPPSAPAPAQPARSAVKNPWRP